MKTPPLLLLSVALAAGTWTLAARAAGSGIAYNLGRFATAVGVSCAGILFAAVGGSYPQVGSFCGLIHALGLVVIWWAPDTSSKKL